MRKDHNGIITIVFVIILFSAVVSLGMHGRAYAADKTPRPSVNGRLHVEGVCLADENGNPVQLRGVSTHGLTWYSDFINNSLFEQVSKDWDCDLIRLAMYASTYDSEEREESYSLMKKGIDLAVANDMYVLVDWHILEKGDPNQQIEAAKDFFKGITEEYSGCPNIIFEICNEPNGEATWGDVIDYSEQIIPLIRSTMPDSVIVVGTPEYDRNLGSAVLRPLDYDNIMYALHFYAASHKEGLRGELKSALKAGLPVFISECGICETSGDGTIDFASATEWFELLDQYHLSYTVWNLSNKGESSAFFKVDYDPYKPITDDKLSVSGLWVRDLIRGTDPMEITVPSPVIEKNTFTVLKSNISNSLGTRGYETMFAWDNFAIVSAVLVLANTFIFAIYRKSRSKKRLTYDDVVPDNTSKGTLVERFLAKPLLAFSVFLTIVYLEWRVVYSIPKEAGINAVIANILLLAVEVFGFVESLAMYRNLLGKKDHPLPAIPDDAWPDVDIFIATYNEPALLLKKTVNGCKHLKYPDKDKVHIWLCDDNRRDQMRKLADEMGVGYFDRPDNKGAKAGNLNNALAHTSSPYVVTLDADMIVRSDFLLKTIPYFIDVELREQERPEEERLHLGLLQTPQSFYDPDVFQHALYSEGRAPNEQDFFYRTVEPAKTATNSVIYGGSNTILSREALTRIGGFYTESITEDFATGLLIEAAGFLGLALPEPLASGQTPHTFKEHIKQRTRWGRGVINTARKLKILRRRDLNAAQKFSYFSSVVYWFSAVKSAIYLVSPLLFATFAIPVLKCNWLDLVVFWLPMFILQDLSLRVNSKNAISTKWSGIYETSVMPALLVPILKESVGISLSSFKVTDKTRHSTDRDSDIKSMLPFIVFIVLSVAGIIRVLYIFNVMQTVSYLILLFWIIRNMYFLIMALFLIDGRDGDGEEVRVIDAEPVRVEDGELKYEGITTLMTEHNMTVYLDEAGDLELGRKVTVYVDGANASACVRGVVTQKKQSRNKHARTHTIEIIDFAGNETEYWQLLYDRIPTLPQSLNRDWGIFSHMWQNVAYRVARTIKY